MIPEQIHECVSRGDIPGGGYRGGVVCGVSVFAGLDHGNKDDALKHSQGGGGHVVGDGTESYLTREGQVQGPDGLDDGRHQQGDDQTLEHAEEQVSDELYVQYLSGCPARETNGKKSIHRT